MRCVLLVWVSVVCASAAGYDSRYGYGEYGYGAVVREPVKPLTWEALAAQAPKRKNVEGLLAWIAREYPEFFRNFTLMRESHSLQAASPRYPRVILFQAGGKLILTFNGDPKAKGFDRVEVMTFREPSPKSALGARFEFRELRYPKAGGVEVSAADPDTCRRCHGTPLRPIWAPYQVWPGAYGKFNDGVPDYDNPRTRGSGTPDEMAGTPAQNEAVRARNVAEEREQLAGYREFREITVTHPRYRFLKFDPASARAPYGEDRHPDDKFRPNLKLTHLLGERFAQQVAGDLAANACFPRYGALILERLLDCRRRDLTPFREVVTARFGPGFNERFEYNSGELPTPLLAIFGFDHTTWNPGERPESWNYFVGISDFAHLVADNLYPELRRRDAGLPAFAPMDDQFYPDTSNDPETRDDGDGNGELPATPLLPRDIRREAACFQLGQRAARADADAAAGCLAASVRARAGHALATCLSCHQSGEDGAPVMPLGDREWLTPARRALVRDRILRTDAKAMPPGRALSIFEREELLRYFAD